MGEAELEEVLVSEALVEKAELEAELELARAWLGNHQGPCKPYSNPSSRGHLYHYLGSRRRCLWSPICSNSS